MPDTQDRHARPFAEFLREQRRGRTHDELSSSLNQLLEAVTETGKGGSLTLTVKVKPAAKGDTHMVTIADQVIVKLPEGDRGEALFFVDDDFNLTRSNPHQPSLPLQAVDGDDPDHEEVAN
jgi:hypothetical protein